MVRIIRTAFWSSTGLLRAGVLGALLLFLFVLALSVSPQLHHAFQHDSEEGQHHCAVTLLHSGQVNVPAPAETAIAPQTWVELPPPEAVSVSSANVELLPAGRAPPVPA